MNTFKRIALAAGAVAATVGPIVLSAQIVAPTPDTPTFEAASVRPAADTGRTGGRGTPGRFNGFNLSVRRLIRQAYDIHDAQIVGGPDWIESQGFDINATTGDKPPDQMRFMMQALLRDRFKLTFHTEKRELPIYALVVARSDGRLGSGLRKIPDGECPPPVARRGAPPASGPPAAPPSPFDPNAQAPCGSIVFGPGRLLAHGVPIDMLARSIGGPPAITAFNRIVVNETKLDGQYDFDFKWTNEFAARGGPPPAGPPPTPAPGDEPTLVTALQEQLGLKLDARRATVDVLVVDSAEKPTEN
jgi:bla regulator protein blaR1